jgi:hypothetical protein
MVPGQRLELQKDLFPYQAQLSLLVVGLYNTKSHLHPSIDN